MHTITKIERLVINLKQDLYGGMMIFAYQIACRWQKYVLLENKRPRSANSNSSRFIQVSRNNFWYNWRYK